MGVKVSGSDVIEDFADTSLQILSNEIVRSLSYLGEQAVNKARMAHKNDWMDRTGNLRSSVGYGVYEEGKQQILSAFQVVREGYEGSEKGKSLVEELARKYSNTYALVVVAAMDYASYVEAHDNRDVLASATLYALSRMNEYMNKAIKSAIKKINKLKA